MRMKPRRPGHHLLRGRGGEDIRIRERNLQSENRIIRDDRSNETLLAEYSRLS
jgi:hypothetical protein